MNKRSRWLLHPAVVYLFLLIVVILMSWIGSVIEIKHSSGNADLIIKSVLDASGVRWAVRSASDCLSNAPIGNAIMFFLTLGVFKGCGLMRAVLNYKSLSPKERTSLHLSLTVLTVCVVLVVLGLFAGSHLLLSVTGRLQGSPLFDGFMFLLMLTVAVPSLVYGFSSDNLRSVNDCMNAFASKALPMSHFVITMLVAAQLIQIIEYTNLYQFIGLSAVSLKYVAFVLYWFPLPVILYMYKQPAN